MLYSIWCLGCLPMATAELPTCVLLNKTNPFWFWYSWHLWCCTTMYYKCHELPLKWPKTVFLAFSSQPTSLGTTALTSWSRYRYIFPTSFINQSLLAYNASLTDPFSLPTQHYLKWYEQCSHINQAHSQHQIDLSESGWSHWISHQLWLLFFRFLALGSPDMADGSFPDFVDRENEFHN